jgi:hypothetical protein
MTDKSLLLRLRAETLQMNLSRLKDHLATPDRMDDLKKLATTAELVRKSIGMADRARASLREKFGGGEKVAWDERLDLEERDSGAETKTVAGTFEDLRRDLDQSRDKLELLQKAIGQMKVKCFLVAENPVGSEIVDGLRDRTKPLIAELGSMQTSEEDTKLLAPRWTILSNRAAAAEPIFTDYMELLGGAALRDTGFDEKISYFADELLKATGGRLLALPVRREALLKTFKQVVRVTFPDWTVWALPSSALELWNVVLHQKVGTTLEASLRTLPIEEQNSIKPEHIQCLGDAYATYTMGPAYSYYAVGLVLALNSEQDQCRLRAILTMLEQMEESPLGTRYMDVRRQLLTAWNAARDQAGQPALNLDVDNAEEADRSDPEGMGVRALVRRFWKTLELETSSKFNAAIWNESTPWVNLLLADKADQIIVPNGVELRHLLNAAWLARVHPDRNSNLDLNAAVKKLQDKVKERREKRGT